MKYHLDFSALLPYWPVFLNGAWLTLKMTAVAVVVGVCVGTAVAFAKRGRNKPLARICSAYVEIVRNTPFLVQLFILYFGLPAINLQVSATEAALIGMIVNLGAYSTEIFRAGIGSIHRSQVEAGLSLGMTRVQIFRHVILKPSVAKVYPALCSQFVLMMLASSVTSAISTQELSSMAAQIDSETFRSIEVYTIVTLIYLGLALLFKAVLTLIGHLIFARRRAAAPQVEIGALANMKEVAP